MEKTEYRENRVHICTRWPPDGNQMQVAACRVCKLLWVVQVAAALYKRARKLRRAVAAVAPLLDAALQEVSAPHRAVPAKSQGLR